MLNIKIYIVSAIIVLSLLGGAYAGFTDQSSAGVSMRAGSVAVEVINAGLGNTTMPYIEGGGQVNEERNGATLWVNRLYPTDKTDKLNFKLDLVNSGNIPVKLDEFEGVMLEMVSGSGQLWDGFNCAIALEVYDSDGSLVKEMKTGSFNFEQVPTKIKYLMSDVVLLPNWVSNYTIYFWLDPDGDSVDSFQNETLRFNIYFNWIQRHM